MTWVVLADDGTALSDWLSRLVDAADRAGMGPFDARLRGHREACRYAIEIAGISALGDARAPVAGVLRQRRVDLIARCLGPVQAAGVVDAWTAGLTLELSSSGGPSDLWLRRQEATTAHVRVPSRAHRAWDLLASLPVSTRTVSPAVELSGRLSPTRPTRRRVVGIASLLVAVVASVLVASSAARRSPASSTVPQGPSSRATPVVDTPPPPSGSAVAADPATGGFLLVGCCDAPRAGMPTPVSTWDWDGSLWNHLHPATVPPYGRNMVLGFDGVSGAFVLRTGDISPATWEWDSGTRNWRFEPDTVQPPAGPATMVAEPSTAAEPIPRLLVVTGGQFSSDLQTWSRIGDGWHLDGAVGVPAPALMGDSPFAIADDEEHGNVVLVLESGAQSRTATYLYDGRAWSAAATTGLPFDPNTQLTWDTWTHRVLAILPGDSGVVGRGAAGTTETWAWDGTVWTRLAASGGPGGRGRLRTSSLGVVVFMSDSATTGRPDVVVWNGVDWNVSPGGTPVTLHQPAPSIADLLGAHRLFMSRGLPAGTDQGAAAEVALHGLPPTCCNEFLRVASTDTGNVIATDTGTSVCLCWVFEVLRTALPTCPGLELVEREAIVLVDVQTNRLIQAIDNAAAPGVTFGSCTG